MLNSTKLCSNESRASYPREHFFLFLNAIFFLLAMKTFLTYGPYFAIWYWCSFFCSFVQISSSFCDARLNNNTHTHSHYQRSRSKSGKKMDVDQSLDAIIKAQPKKKTANANARGKAGASMKKSSSSFGLQKSKQSNKQIAQKSKQMKVAVRPVSRGAIKKPTRKPVGGRAIGMAIDGHISTGGGSIVRGSANQSKTSNEQPTKLIVSNLDFNVTEKDIKVRYKIYVCLCSSRRSRKG